MLTVERWNWQSKNRIFVSKQNMTCWPDKSCREVYSCGCRLALSHPRAYGRSLALLCHRVSMLCDGYVCMYVWVPYTLHRIQQYHFIPRPRTAALLRSHSPPSHKTSKTNSNKSKYPALSPSPPVSLSLSLSFSISISISNPNPSNTDLLSSGSRFKTIDPI